MEAPYTVGPIMYAPKSLGIVVELKDVPGALLKVLECVYRLGINIAKVSSSSPTERGTKYVFLAFYEATDKLISKLCSELSALDVVVSVEVLRPNCAGFIVTKRMYPPMLVSYNDKGIRAMLVDVGIAREIEGLKNKRPTLYQMFPVFLYYLGRTIGCTIAKTILSTCKSRPPYRDFLNALADFMTVFGYGHATIEYRLDFPRMILYDPIVIYRDAPLIRGIISGALTVYFDNEVNIRPEDISLEEERGVKKLTVTIVIG